MDILFEFHIYLPGLQIEIALWHECSPVNLLYIFRTPFLKNNSRWLLLLVVVSSCLSTETTIRVVSEVTYPKTLTKCFP